MTREDVLAIFADQASRLGEVPATQSEIILQLADLLADSGARFSSENFEKLTHIGAVMYQESLGRFRARAEVATIMQKSADKRKQHE